MNFFLRLVVVIVRKCKLSPQKLSMAVSYLGHLTSLLSLTTGDICVEGCAKDNSEAVQST